MGVLMSLILFHEMHLKELYFDAVQMEKENSLRGKFGNMQLLLILAESVYTCVLPCLQAMSCDMLVCRKVMLRTSHIKC